MFKSRIPVFCVTPTISGETLDAFFQKANDAIVQEDFEEPMGFLMASSKVPKYADQESTKSPVDKNILVHNPFEGKSTEGVNTWAQRHLTMSGLSPDNMVILDERTAQDNTCLLVSLRDLPDQHMPEGMDKWLLVRSDFESSIVTLVLKETFAGGDEQLEVDYEGSDGVLRRGIKYRE